MRVVINAQLDPLRSGGIAQVLFGLAHGLGQLAGPEEYVFVCSPASAAWLRPQLSGGVRVTVNEKRTPSPPRGPRASDGFWEALEPDVLHFPYQSYTRTTVPSVFNPHDLQHVHLPELFTGEERERREALYGAACVHSAAVIVASEWIRRDVIDHYALDPAKVHLVAWGVPTAIYPRPSDAEVEATLSQLGVPADFMLYPAQTWPHKNHERLIDAVARLRDRHGMNVPLVCTGALTDHAEALRERIARWGLMDLVHFLGRVEERTLLALYRRARLVVIPTLFEAVSFPIDEAFAERVPVACSKVTSLPEQVGDAAVVFDPRSVEEIAGAIRRVYSDEALREALVARGVARVAELTWRRTAEGYREVYRAVAGFRATASQVAGSSVPTSACDGSISSGRKVRAAEAPSCQSRV